MDMITGVHMNMKRGFAEVPQRGKPAAALGYPELEPAAEEIRIAASTQDNSITVIENPSLNVLLGILLSRHFDKQSLGKLVLPDGYASLRLG